MIKNFRLSIALSSLLIMGYDSAFVQTTKSPYQVKPKPGKLPMPQHDPAFTKQQFDSMSNAVYILNNFGLYQSSNTEKSAYLHDGLDFMAPNGTRIFAVQSGVVKRIFMGPQYYRSLLVQDANDSLLAWSYAHIDSFQVKSGDTIKQGNLLGFVTFFPGSEHLHLDRVYRKAGIKWSQWEALPHLNPVSHFDFEDKEAPVFDEHFYYFYNDSNKVFDRTNGRVVLSGTVDIVVGSRDGGKVARAASTDTSKFYLGDRLAITRMAYEIESLGKKGKKKRFPSFDFNSIELQSSANKKAADVALTVFKFFPLIHPAKEWFRTKYSYYTITNFSEEASTNFIDSGLAANSWNTDLKDKKGQRIYPNGEYNIIVHAWDANGNHSMKKEKVTVRN